MKLSDYVVLLSAAIGYGWVLWKARKCENDRDPDDPPFLF